MNYPLVIGVTGPIGSGKTTFCKEIVKKDKTFLHINSDRIVEHLYLVNNQGWNALKILNNDCIFLPNMSINKEALANYIFSSIRNRNIVEKLIHPLVFQEIEKIISANKDKKLILIEAIKFPPKNQFLDHLILITAPFREVKKRYQKRYNLVLLKKIYELYKYPKKSKLKIENKSSLRSYRNTINRVFQNIIHIMHLTCAKEDKDIV